MLGEDRDCKHCQYWRECNSMGDNGPTRACKDYKEIRREKIPIERTVGVSADRARVR